MKRIKLSDYNSNMGILIDVRNPEDYKNNPNLGSINIYADKLLMNYKSILDRIPKDKKMTEVRPEREQIKIILDRYPSSETLFRQTKDMIKKGGFWKYGY